MSRLVRRLLGRSGDPDDVLQQAMMELTQSLHAFRGESSVWHYASRIVVRVALGAIRKHRAEDNRAAGDAPLDALESPAAALPEQVAAERRRRALDELLRALPEEQAETLVLRVVLGFTLPEVAEATGAPVNTVRSRIRLAKEALRARIEADAALLECFEVKE